MKGGILHVLKNIIAANGVPSTSYYYMGVIIMIIDSYDE